MSRKLRFFRDQMIKAGLSPSTRSALRPDIELDDLEIKLGELEAELTEINGNNEKLQRSHNELQEFKLVLQKAGSFFSLARSTAAAHQREIEETSYVGEGSMDSPLLLEQEMLTEPSKQVRLGFISGLVPKAKAIPFERILFRATRGNMFLKMSAVEQPVTDPVSGEKVWTQSS
jgi:V-type H+-transporting ATPase subunit a